MYNIVIEKSELYDMYNLKAVLVYNESIYFFLIQEKLSTDFFNFFNCNAILSVRFFKLP